MRIQERLRATKGTGQTSGRGWIDSTGKCHIETDPEPQILVNPDGPEAAALIDKLQALLDEAERVVEELANDLEAEVKQRWGDDERLASRLACDLSPVVEARAFLAKLKEQPNGND